MFSYKLDPRWEIYLKEDKEKQEKIREEVKKKHSHLFWKTKDGNRMKVSNMTVQHLQNSIQLIKRKSPWRKDWLPILEEELSSRIQ